MFTLPSMPISLSKIDPAYIMLLGAVLLVFVFLLVLVHKKKKKGLLRRGMNLALFLVTLPQREDKETSLEEFLKSSQQFYSALTAVREKSKLKRYFLGHPSLVFEIAVHPNSEQIYFYFACPRFLAPLVEKTVLSFWPKAHIQPSADYNIFNPTGFAVGRQAGLKQAMAIPLKSYKDFAVDPLASLTSVLTKLHKEEEGAAIQIMLRPSRISLKKSGQEIVSRITKSGDKATDKPGEVKPIPELSVPDQQKVDAILNKISQPLFDVNLRLLASGQTKERVNQIILELQSAFEQFNHPNLNQLTFKKSSFKGNIKKLFYYFSFRIFNEKSSILLSEEELTALFHFPSPQLATPHIKWLKSKQAPPPDNLPAEGLVVGKSVFRDKERPVRILSDDRRRHFYIIGQTGTGKSALIQEMVRQDMEAGKGVCLIDPHGDLAEKVLSLVPRSRAEEVVYFNPGDVEKPLGLNMLEYDARFPEAKTFVVNEMIEIFEKLYNLKAQGFGGPIFEQYMRNALLLIMEDPEAQSTLIEIPKVLADSEFRKEKLAYCRNMVVKNFWEKEAEKAGGEAALANMVPYITSKMNVFIANDLVRPIISQKTSAFNLREIMDQQKILIVNLSKGKLGDINSYLLGMIIMGKLLVATYSRADAPEEERKDFYLYIDEFQNITTQSIASALAEARKYRLNMIFAHQFIGQLDEDTRKAIFGNVGSLMAFRVGADDAKYLISEFAPMFDEEDLVGMDNYHAAFRYLIKGEVTTAFNILTYPPTKGDRELAETIKEYSRLRYGTDRILVEEELLARM